MQDVLKIVEGFQLYILAALFVLIIILFIMIITAFKSLNRVEKKYRKLMRGVDNKNLEQLIMGYLDNIDDAK